MRFRIKHPLPVNIFLLLAASLVGIGATRMARTTLSLRAEMRETGARLTAIAAHKDQIARRLAEQDAPETVDYRAKATMNLKNPGEEAVVVVPEEKLMDTAGSPGIWQRLRDFFSEMF